MKNRKKKHLKLAAQRGHGYGSHKKNRGAGHRGGRGNAGSGKRGDAKKPNNWADKTYFGKSGFKTHKKSIVKTLTLASLSDRIPKLLEAKLIEEKSGVYVVDLKKLGYDKLLATGKITKKFKITTPYSSHNAVEKVKAAGGEVIVTEADSDDEFEPAEKKPAKEKKPKAAETEN